MSPRICYVPKTFRDGTLAIIDAANAIIGEYADEGFILTLRQLYYQFVARGLIRNLQREYKRLGSIINDGRLAGLIDWDLIEDRTRNLEERSHWEDPEAIILDSARAYGVDRWEGQEHRVEVWIEKDALVGVIERACRDLDVPYFSCRGYTSQSELWRAAMRLSRWARAGYKPVVIHLGDHDPSGIDMTRDIAYRLELFFERHGSDPPIVDRIALTMDQIKEHNPPPNPAKVTDSRYWSYANEHGDESWELDALDPRFIDSLIRGAVDGYLDSELWDERVAEENEGIRLLNVVAERWQDLTEGLTTEEEDE